MKWIRVLAVFLILLFAVGNSGLGSACGQSQPPWPNSTPIPAGAGLPVGAAPQIIGYDTFGNGEAETMSADGGDCPTASLTRTAAGAYGLTLGCSIPITHVTGASGVTPGSYTSANITVNGLGLVTAASNGTLATNSWCNGSSAPIPYGNLPVAPTAYCEQWATFVPGGACRAHLPPSYVFGINAPSLIDWTYAAIAIAPSMAAAPVVTASTTNTNGSSTISVPTGANGKLLIMFDGDWQYATTPSGWVLIGEDQVNLPHLQAFGRIGSNEPVSYTLSNTRFPAISMLAISGAQPIAVPDTSTFGHHANDTGATVPALNGLSSSTDLLLEGVTWPFSNSFVNQGTTTQVQYIYPQANNVGLWVGDLALSTNSSASQPFTSTALPQQTCKLFYDGTEYIEEGF